MLYCSVFDDSSAVVYTLSAGLNRYPALQFVPDPLPPLCLHSRWLISGGRSQLSCVLLIAPPMTIEVFSAADLQINVCSVG